MDNKVFWDWGVFFDFFDLILKGDYVYIVDVMVGEYVRL